MSNVFNIYEEGIILSDYVRKESGRCQMVMMERCQDVKSMVWPKVEPVRKMLSLPKFIHYGMLLLQLEKFCVHLPGTYNIYFLQRCISG